MDVAHTAPVERASAADLGQLASDAGSVPNQVGAVLVIDTRDLAAGEIAQRLAHVPRLRQRLVSVPLGGGPPIWVDDPHLDLAQHVVVVDCPEPRDETALLALAAERLTTPLPRDRPLWSVTIVRGLDGGRTALVVVFHHVVADGIGGLAVLARLLDGVPVPPGRPPPAAAPSWRALRADAADRRRAAVRGLPAAVDRGRDGVRELARRPTVAEACSLNRPTGAQRRIVTVQAQLATLKQRGAADGASVNDVLLAAITAALARLLHHRGEHVDRLVVSMLVAPPAHTAVGNQAGVAPVALPAHGPARDRLRAIAASTREVKRHARGASAPLLGLGLRVLARLRLLRRLMDRQRMVHTFVTNLRGPDRQVAVGGAVVSGMIPLSLATGNVTVAFAALSYAGTMTVTVVVDPTHHPDLDVLVAALHDELAVGSDEDLPGSGDDRGQPTTR